MNQVFPITPAPGGVFWVLGPVGLLMLLVLVLFAYISYSTTHVRFGGVAGWIANTRRSLRAARAGIVSGASGSQGN